MPRSRTSLTQSKFQVGSVTAQDQEEWDPLSDLTWISASLIVQAPEPGQLFERSQPHKLTGASPSLNPKQTSSIISSKFPTAARLQFLRPASTSSRPASSRANLGRILSTSRCGVFPRFPKPLAIGILALAQGNDMFYFAAEARDSRPFRQARQAAPSSTRFFLPPKWTRYIQKKSSGARQERW